MDRIYLAIYIFLYILQDLSNRTSISAAYEYQKSKSKARKERKRFTLWERITCKCERVSKTFAQRHMKLFLFQFYCNHLLSVILVSLWIIGCCIRSAQFMGIVYILMVAKILIFDGIFNLYEMVCLILGGGTRTRWNFDIFKKP